jgi:hypothetical protein
MHRYDITALYSNRSEDIRNICEIQNVTKWAESEDEHKDIM